jgi:Tfp pilus assembly protein PilF
VSDAWRGTIAIGPRRFWQTRARRASRRRQRRALRSGCSSIRITCAHSLVENGDPARGLAILQKAHAQAPKARDIRFHIAAGYYKLGDTAAARKELEGLMSGDMRFAQADDARALLKQLQ